MEKIVKRRGRPPGSKNKKQTVVVEKVAKKRGRPAGTKNKTTKKKVHDTSTNERLDRVFMIEDMFYSSTKTEEAKNEYAKTYPGEGKFFKREWSRVAGDVANVMLGKYSSTRLVKDDDE
tara:strand:+ start:140 stop:496 length:357 start_codon:yes stop_codon:yes gene_type:complete